MLRVAERVRRGTAPAEHAALRDTYRHDATSRNRTRPGGELARDYAAPSTGQKFVPEMWFLEFQNISLTYQ